MQDTLSSFWQIVRSIVWDHLVQVYRACRSYAVSRLTKMASSVLNNLPSHYLQTQIAPSVLNNLPSHYLQPYIADELRGLSMSLVEMKPLADFFWHACVRASIKPSPAIIIRTKLGGIISWVSHGSQWQIASHIWKQTGYWILAELCLSATLRDASQLSQRGDYWFHSIMRFTSMTPTASVRRHVYVGVPVGVKWTNNFHRANHLIHASVSTARVYHPFEGNATWLVSEKGSSSTGVPKPANAKLCVCC